MHVRTPLRWRWVCWRLALCLTALAQQVGTFNYRVAARGRLPLTTARMLPGYVCADCHTRLAATGTQLFQTRKQGLISVADHSGNGNASPATTAGRLLHVRPVPQVASSAQVSAPQPEPHAELRSMVMATSATLVPPRHTGRRTAGVHRGRRIHRGFLGPEVRFHRHVLHVLPRNGHAIPGTDPERALLQSTRISASWPTAMCRPHSCPACYGTLRLGGTVGHMTENRHPAKYEAHRMKLASSLEELSE